MEALFISGADHAMQSRHTLRHALKAKRRSISLEKCITASRQIADSIATTAWFQRSQHLGFYSATQGELDPSPLIEQAWSMGKTCYLPILHPLKHNALWFIPYFPGDPLIANRYGILEPVHNRHNPRAPYALNLVFTPLVAFDDVGTRLGSGKGYYDRTFSYLQHSKYRHKPLLVGLAYAFQRVPELVRQPWDIPLDKVVVFE